MGKVAVTRCTAASSSSVCARCTAMPSIPNSSSAISNRSWASARLPRWARARPSAIWTMPQSGSAVSPWSPAMVAARSASDAAVWPSSSSAAVSDSTASPVIIAYGCSAADTCAIRLSRGGVASADRPDRYRAWPRAAWAIQWNGVRSGPASRSAQRAAWRAPPTSSNTMAARVRAAPKASELTPAGNAPCQAGSSTTASRRSMSCLEAPPKPPIQAATKATGGLAAIASSGSASIQRETIARRPLRQYASQEAAISAPASVSSPAAVTW
jgi:hypothetical protein